MKKGYALVVGITHYQSNALKNLETPHLNAEAVAQVLEKHGNFSDPTRLPAKWLSRYTAEVAKGELTSEELIEKLRYLLLEQAKDSEALIYFSGHGIAKVSKVSGKQEGFLATSDCEVEMEGQQVTGQKNGISLRELNDLICEAKVSSLVVLLDCCHAGSLLKNNLVKQTLTAFNEKDYFLIAACRPQEKAYEGENYSIFTEALLKGLSEEQAGNDGKIRCDSLSAVIAEELERKGQEPIRLGYGRSLVVVSYPGQSLPEAVEPLLDEKGEIRCPYQGLLAFTKAELPFFFGRKQVVEELERKLARQPFVPLIGASGSGKSSVVLAGLIPWLEKAGWQVLDPIKPGFKPLGRLEEVLRQNYFSEEEQLLDECIHDESSEGLKPLLERLLERFPQGRHLLVVDQFEELFTVAQAEQSDRFIQLITQVTELPNSPLAVVTTMRADFLEPCLDYEPLRQLIEQEAKYLPTLARKNLIDAICEPAKRQGYEVTEELLYQIRDDIKQEPGSLPLLEFALTQLWDKRDQVRHQLTLEGYEAIGGMVGALNIHADKVFQYRDYEKDSPQDERAEAEKGLIKRIFLKLLQIGEGEKDTRVRQPKAVILSILSLAGNNLIDGKQGLVKGRLLVIGGSEEERTAWVDLAHEALIEGWTQLNEWRTDNREGRRIARQVEYDAQNWQEHDKLPDYLWRGIKLNEAEKVLSEYAAIEPLSNLAEEFLEECRKQELRSYLLFSDVDSLDRKALEKKAAVKSFLTIPRLWSLLENEREEGKTRLAAFWLLKRWGEDVRLLLEIDNEGKMRSLHVLEPLPTMVEDLGNSISLELVEIPGDKFMMGSPKGEGRDNEKPQHEVNVQPFFMGKYLITQAQYQEVMSKNPSNFKGDDYPVEQVSWDDAVEFCQRLSKQTGKEYRLPTEAKWEYACRAGTTTLYHFGETITDKLANYGGNVGETTSVGQFLPNAFGLYDMHGNVWEWCQDDWHNSYQDAPNDSRAWLSKESSTKVIRGGSWYDLPYICRSAIRTTDTRDFRDYLIGFRVVCVAPRTT